MLIVVYLIKNVVKRLEYVIYFKEKNVLGGKRLSEYLCKLNDEVVFGRVIIFSENINLFEEMKWNDFGR